MLLLPQLGSAEPTRKNASLLILALTFCSVILTRHTRGDWDPYLLRCMYGVVAAAALLIMIQVAEILSAARISSPLARLARILRHWMKLPPKFGLLLRGKGPSMCLFRVLIIPCMYDMTICRSTRPGQRPNRRTKFLRSTPEFASASMRLLAAPLRSHAKSRLGSILGRPILRHGAPLFLAGVLSFMLLPSGFKPPPQRCGAIARPFVRVLKKEPTRTYRLVIGDHAAWPFAAPLALALLRNNFSLCVDAEWGYLFDTALVCTQSQREWPPLVVYRSVPEPVPPEFTGLQTFKGPLNTILWGFSERSSPHQECGGSCHGSPRKMTRLLHPSVSPAPYGQFGEPHELLAHAHRTEGAH
jgi:hypothetical protein